MNKISCLIVDDEAMARKGLEKYVQQIEFLALEGLCRNAIQAREKMLEKNIDLLFLDINMPGMKGTDFLRSLQHAPKVIFTTAYSEYALESFEFDVVDYLVKPISFERFLQAANKALRLFTTSAGRTLTNGLSSDSIEQSELPTYFFIKDGQILVKVEIPSIRYIEAAQNYIQIITDQGKHMTLMPLKDVMELLPAAEFIQVHRSCIVAKSKITAVDGNELLLGSDRIAMSRRMKEEVMEKLLRG